MLCLQEAAQTTTESLVSIPGFSDPVSSLSHLIATVAFAIATVPLLRCAGDNRGRRAALAIFAASVVLQLALSGVFHMLPNESAGRDVLQRLDHACIFVLIAGTITAVHAMLFRGFLRYGVIAFAWIVAATAIPLKTIFFDEFPEGLGLTLYLVFPWLGLGTGVLLWRRRGLRYIATFMLAGVAYTLGAVIDFMRWPTPWTGVLQAHELFHFCVIGGVWFHWHFCTRVATEAAAYDAQHARASKQ